jgi:hypothetical protein
MHFFIFCTRVLSGLHGFLTQMRSDVLALHRSIGRSGMVAARAAQMVGLRSRLEGLGLWETLRGGGCLLRLPLDPPLHITCCTVVLAIL